MKKEACVIANGECNVCTYADRCRESLAPTIEVDTASMELCKGRHATPAEDGAIFETEVDPLAVAALEEQAMERLAALNITKLHLYVTGLTVALVAALNAARKLDIKVTLWHFDRNAGKYYSQEVI